MTSSVLFFFKLSKTPPEPQWTSCYWVKLRALASMAVDYSLGAIWPLLRLPDNYLHSRWNQLQDTSTHCSSITSYLELTTKHLIIVSALTVINVLCPAGVKTTAARAAYWFPLCVCWQAVRDTLNISSCMKTRLHGSYFGVKRSAYYITIF